MATEEEIIKIRIEAETDKAEKAKQALADLGAQAAALKAQMQAAGGGTAQMQADLAKLQQQIGRAGSAMDAAHGQLANLGAGSRNSGRALLELSRGAEDAQYGLAGVLNNIPSLVTSLGGAAGLAGTLSLVAVGAKVLYDHWDKLAGAFGAGHVKTQAEAMAELAKQTEKTVEQTKQLLDFEAKQGATKKLLGTQTKDEGQNSKAVDEILGGVSDKVRLLKELGNSVANDGGVVYTKDEKKQLKHAAELQSLGEELDSGRKTRVIGTEGQEQDEARAIRLRVEAAARGRVNDQMAAEFGDAANNPAKLQNLVDRLKKSRGADSPLVQDLEFFQEHGTTRDDAIEKDQKKNEELAKATAARRKARQQADEKDAAGGLQERFNDFQARGVSITPAQITQELTRTGRAKTPEDAARMTPGVLKDLREGSDKFFSKKAEETGTTVDQAKKNYLAEERAVIDKRAKEWDRQLSEEKSVIDDRAKDWDHNLAKEADEVKHNYDEFNKKHADEIAAGTAQDERAQAAFVRYQLQGASGGQALAGITEGIKRELMAGGMGEEEAAKEAAERAKKEAAAVNDKIAKAGFGTQTAGANGNQAGIMDLARATQAASQEKMLSLTEQISRGIEQLVNQPLRMR